MFRQENEYYQTLGLEPTASIDEINEAYYRLVRSIAPDSPNAKERLKQLTTIHQVLLDPLQASVYRNFLAILAYYNNNGPQAFANPTPESRQLFQKIDESLKLISNNEKQHLLMPIKAVFAHYQHLGNLLKIMQEIAQSYPSERYIFGLTAIISKLKFLVEHYHLDLISITTIEMNRLYTTLTQICNQDAIGKTLSFDRRNSPLQIVIDLGASVDRDQHRQQVEWVVEKIIQGPLRGSLSDYYLLSPSDPNALSRYVILDIKPESIDQARPAPTRNFFEVLGIRRIGPREENLKSLTESLLKSLQLDQSDYVSQYQEIKTAYLILNERQHEAAYRKYLVLQSKLKRDPEELPSKGYHPIIYSSLKEVVHHYKKILHGFDKLMARNFNSFEVLSIDLALLLDLAKTLHEFIGRQRAADLPDLVDEKLHNEFKELIGSYQERLYNETLVETLHLQDYLNSILNADLSEPIFKLLPYDSAAPFKLEIDLNTGEGNYHDKAKYVLEKLRNNPLSKFFVLPPQQLEMNIQNGHFVLEIKPAYFDEVRVARKAKKPIVVDSPRENETLALRKYKSGLFDYIYTRVHQGKGIGKFKKQDKVGAAKNLLDGLAGRTPLEMFYHAKTREALETGKLGKIAKQPLELLTKRRKHS